MKMPRLEILRATAFASYPLNNLTGKFEQIIPYCRKKCKFHSLKAVRESMQWLPNVGLQWLPNVGLQWLPKNRPEL